MPDYPFLIVSTALLLTVFFLAAQWFKQRTKLKRYRPIEDAEQEAQRILDTAEKTALESERKQQQQIEEAQREAQRIRGDAEKAAQELEKKQTALTYQVRELETRKQLIEGEVEVLDDAHLLQSFGLYEPKYDFADSAKYRARLEAIRQQQKQLIRGKTAAACRIEWTVDGNRAKGKKQTDKLLKLMLRAFNGECDTLIMKVKFNNVTAIETRINKEWETINKLGEENGCEIASRYLELKLQELFLAHEYAEKVQEEKEEQRRIREQMREEEKARIEMEKVIAEAEKEEARYQKALEKARGEVEQATGKKHDQLVAQIAQLDEALREAEERHQRAESRAQMTRSGYVYVISNIGSFGDDVFKIGMTRRLEPLDRVRELGDSSVPFQFDVHGMIFSEDAPTLETKLHRRFKDKSVNKVNFRKEFFQVTLGEIEEAVKSEGLDIELTKLAQAEEYRKSLMMSKVLTDGHAPSRMFETVEVTQGTS